MYISEGGARPAQLPPEGPEGVGHLEAVHLGPPGRLG